MTRTIENIAMSRHKARTHVKLAHALGRHDLVAVFEHLVAVPEPPPLVEQMRDRAEHDLRQAIEDAARLLSPADAARIASEAVADVLRVRT